MNKDDIVSFWVETGEADYKTMHNLFASNDYHWSLFMAHLVIEKFLKGLYCQRIGEIAPRTHDLLSLAEKLSLDMDDATKDLLDTITTFNLNARYPDYKKRFYEKCTREYTEKMLVKVEGLKKWILEMLQA